MFNQDDFQKEFISFLQQLQTIRNNIISSKTENLDTDFTSLLKTKPPIEESEQITQLKQELQQQIDSVKEDMVTWSQEIANLQSSVSTLTSLSEAQKAVSKADEAFTCTTDVQQEPLKIALVGKMRSGKDTVADILQKEYKFNRIAFGDKLKELAHMIFPHVPLDPKPRELYLFMNVMREFYEDVWVYHLANTYNSIKNNSHGIVITDVRQQNELDWCKKNGFTILKVVCDDIIRLERIKASGDAHKEEYLTHNTESSVDQLEFDDWIDNSGNLEDLREQVVMTLHNIVRKLHTNKNQ